MRISINYQWQNTCFTWSGKIKWCKPQVLQFNSCSVSSPLTAFPGFITIVDCQRTYLVVGLPDLLLPASNLIGSEKLSAGVCSPSFSWPPDAGESSDSTDPRCNATRRCSSRQLKQKLFPSFIIWTFPTIYTQVNFYRHGGQSGIQGDLPLTVPAMWSSRNASPLGGDLLKELQGRKDDIPLVIVLESNYVAFWMDNLIFFGGVLNCSLSFTPLNLFQQIDFSICLRIPSEHTQSK